MNHLVALTFDVDWAPDWVLEAVFKQLEKYNIRSTWFLTHQSEYIDYLKSQTHLVETGIHPNFLPNSSQGNSYDKVFNNLLKWFPGSQIMRSHSLYQSEKLLGIANNKYGIKIDCSLYLRGCSNITSHSIRYVPNGKLLWRVPHFYQDNMDIMHNTPFHLENINIESEGLKVFNFHPIHIVLNTNKGENYNRFKSELGIENASIDNIAQFINKGAGVKTLFNELCNYLTDIGSTKVISELIPNELD